MGRGSGGGVVPDRAVPEAWRIYNLTFLGSFFHFLLGTRFWSIFDPFLDDFWSILGLNMGPKWRSFWGLFSSPLFNCFFVIVCMSQTRQIIKNHRFFTGFDDFHMLATFSYMLKNHPFFIDFWTKFWLNFGQKIDTLSGSSLASIFGQTLTNFGPILDPSWAQVGPKKGETRFQKLRLKESCFRGPIWDPCWTHFGPILGPCWTHFGPFWSLNWSFLG